MRGIPLENLSEERFETWACLSCKRAFGALTDLAHHLVEVHEEVEKIRRRRDGYLYRGYTYQGRTYKRPELLARVHRSGKHLKKVRCPECGGWGAYGKRSLKCAHCGSRFRARESAFMDGVYLDEWEVRDRYQRYIREGCRRLELPKETADKAVETVNRLPSTFKGGKNPRVISAGAVYASAILTGRRRTRRDVAEVFNTCPASLGNHYKGIVEELEIDTGGCSEA